MTDLGFLEIYVSLSTYDRYGHVFEFELIDCEGEAVYYMQEGVGIEYWLKDIICEAEAMRGGCTYRFNDLTYTYYPGETMWDSACPRDPDEEWEFASITKKINWLVWISQKIKNIWWCHIGSHLKTMEARDEEET